jgi:heme exporter protein D
MKKVLYVFSAVAIAVLTACGPSAEELAQKEKMRQDSLEAVQAARQDSLDAANAMEQARIDSISAAEAMAAAQTPVAAKGGSTKPKAAAPATPKEEPKAAEPVKKGGMKGGANTGNETPKSGETPVKKGGMKDGIK